MPTYYCSDAQVTAWLPSDLTNTVIATASARNTQLRTPAKAWIDSVYPDDAPFADVSASPDTPDIIQQAATYYAAGLAFAILAKNPSDGQAEVMHKMAADLLQIDEETGLARTRIAEIHSATRLGLVDVTRSRDDEDRDEDANQAELFP